MSPRHPTIPTATHAQQLFCPTPKRHGKSRRRPLVFTNTSFIISALKPRGLDGLNIRCVSKRCCAKSCRVMPHPRARGHELRLRQQHVVVHTSFFKYHGALQFRRALRHNAIEFAQAEQWDDSEQVQSVQYSCVAFLYSCSSNVTAAALLVCVGAF